VHGRAAAAVCARWIGCPPAIDREGFIQMFSTKRLGLLLAALLAATMSFGIITSGAWFTDSDTVAVTATSGEIDIEANPVSFSVDDLMPGTWSAPQEITVYNTANSTTAVKYRITADPGTESVAGFFDALQVRIVQMHCGSSSPANTPVEGALSALSATNADSTHPAGLPINYTHCYDVSFGLLSTAGNVFQDQTATFDLVIDATQPENPGFSE
jgi:hypothetical protein